MIRTVQLSISVKCNIFNKHKVYNQTYHIILFNNIEKLRRFLFKFIPKLYRVLRFAKKNLFEFVTLVL